VRIAVLGAGGVGGYFGGRLAHAGADVRFVARGPQLTALRERGLQVRSVNGDFRVRAAATDDAKEIGPCDIVLFCVKSYDTETAAAMLPPLLHAGTGVLSLQNGVDNVEKLEAAVGRRHVLAGAAYVFATIVEPGVVAHTAGPGAIAFGERDGTRSERAEQLLRWCERAGIGAELDPDVTARLWDKFVLICAQAGMTAAARLPIGEIRGHPEAWRMFRRISDEVAALAAAEGVALPSDAVERNCEFARQLAPGSTSSLHNDLVNGRRLELEALHGFVVRRARERSVDVPACEAVYALLAPWAERHG